MNTTAAGVLKRFEEFLKSIPLESYREELIHIKTVEQDLPKSLNPLPAIYEAYWTEALHEFPSYERFFAEWWEAKLPAVDEFVRKYFWGCSWEFVRLGFKARLYRTLISVLTQFHFCYTWKAYCTAPITANWELDLQGIDAEIQEENLKVALQIKKETYRAEASTSGRFARRQRKYPLIVEVPYTVNPPEEWLRIAERARSASRREQAELFYFCASQFQRWLENGFVVFEPEYPIAVEQFIKRMIKQEDRPEKYYDWNSLLASIVRQRNEEGSI